MHVAVTGSSGLIGSHLLKFLKQSPELSVNVLERKKSLPSSEAGIDWPEGLSRLDFSSTDAIVHLAFDKGTSNNPFPESGNIRALKLIIKRIKETNPECRLIFLTSQSASDAPDASPYGKLKIEQEKIIESSGIKYTIIRPGLVFGAGNKGLFGRLRSLTQYSPIIPVLSSGLGYPIVIQPIDVADLSRAIISVILKPSAVGQKNIFLAGPPISFELFLRLVVMLLGKRRIFLRLPTKLISKTLGLLENLFPKFPFTKSSLAGLTQLQVHDAKEGWLLVGVKPTPLINGLRRSISPDSPEVPIDIVNGELDTELHWLHFALYKVIPTPLMRMRYQAAHAYCCIPNGLDHSILQALTNYSLDPVVLEQLLRRAPTKDNKNIISRKFLLISYLAEMESIYLERYISLNNSQIRAFAILPWSVAKTVLAALQGRYMLWRYQKCLMQS